MPVVRPQHRNECMPSEQSLCHGTSEMPSTTPIGLTSASVLLPAACRNNARSQSTTRRTARVAERSEPTEPSAGEHLAHALGVLLEVRHPHTRIVTASGLRPPGTAVAT